MTNEEIRPTVYEELKSMSLDEMARALLNICKNAKKTHQKEKMCLTGQCFDCIKYWLGTQSNKNLKK